MKMIPRTWAIHACGLLAVAAVGGFLAMASGVIPIKASSGHWPVTKWLLSFSMSRSVSTHSMGVRAPEDFRERSLVMKGAGAFEVGCVPCHGSPIWQRPRIAQGLTPTPPALAAKVGEWTPAELFYIVKHGVKFTGMPAFPSQQRDDEVWAIVGFMLELTKLDADGYRKLVDVDPRDDEINAPFAVIETCAACHGFDGLGRGAGAFPRLAGLHTEYFSATMRAYAQGERHSGIMEPIAARLTSEEIDALAEFYSGRESDQAISSIANAKDEKGNAESVARGKVIATKGLESQDVGACVACHPTNRSGQNPNYPALPGQFAKYLVLQIEQLQQRNRGGTPHAHLMHAIVDGLEADQIHDVAAYYASLGLDN